MKEPPERPNPRRTYIWWILALLLVSWAMLWIAQIRATPQQAIAYSAFVNDVRAGKVSKVTISGDQISGTLKGSGKHSFSTTFPQNVGDNQLMPMLRSRNVTVDVTQPSPPVLWTLVGWLPFLVIGGVFFWIIMRARNQVTGPLTSFGRTKARRYSQNGRSKVTFRDVAGVDEAKAELEEEVDFLRNPKKYRDLGAQIPKGLLLVGSPGTGKTLLARAVAGESGASFFSLNASEFVEMFVGVGASRVRDLFTEAKAASPAIVFIDELDSVGRRRGAGVGTVNDEREQTLNQLLAELDGFDPRYDVIIMAATNRPDVLDPALLRPGRFDRQVVLDLPDRAGREAILHIHASKLRLGNNVDLEQISRITIGESGADLANLCNEAALTAARHNRSSVTMNDFYEAQDKLRLGLARPRLADPQERRVIAYHEGGHALAAWLLPCADPVKKITIVPRGRALGQTEQIPDTERHNLSLSYLNTRLAVMLAGRVSEQIVFGEITTGAENDLKEATTLARRMVTRWGMGEDGLFAVSIDEEQPFLGYEITRREEYSDATAARIDADVARLLSQAHDKVKRCLSDAREKLDRLAEALLREETLEFPALERLLGDRAA
jgi:cell division protease FtsH